MVEPVQTKFPRGRKPSPAGDRKVGRDVVWGLKWGTALGVVYAIIGTICWLTQPIAEDPRFRGVTLPLLLGFYMVGGPTVGLITGLLRPLIARRAGASVVGAIAVAPLMAVIALFRTPLPRWGFPEIFTVIVGSAFLGGMGGRILWRPPGSVFTHDYLEEIKDGSRRARRKHGRGGRASSVTDGTAAHDGESRP